MKPVVRPLMRAASVTEMRREVRSFRGGILVISSHGETRDSKYWKEPKERSYYICAKPIRARMALEERRRHIPVLIATDE